MSKVEGQHLILVRSYVILAHLHWQGIAPLFQEGRDSREQRQPFLYR